MKTKLLIMITILIIAASCSKTVTNPTSENTYRHNTPTKEGLKDYGIPEDDISFEDTSIKFRGKGIEIIKSLDGTFSDKPDEMQIKVDILDDNTALICTPNVFIFRNVILDNSKHDYFFKDERGEYSLTMKLGRDSSSITDFKLVIFGNGEEYKYHITAEKLDRIQNN